MQSPTYTSPSLDLPTNTDKNVQGWLMGVPGYRDTATLPQEPLVLPVDHALSAAPKRQERRKSTSSTASDDSVNLDDLINKNNILSVDDETDLPNLSTLDLDDNKEDFWQLDHATFLQDRGTQLQKPKVPTALRKSPLASSVGDVLESNAPLRRLRSPSINSDDHQSSSSGSLTLPSPNQQQLYGNRLPPPDTPRTASRMSNYSTTSSTTSSHTNNIHSALPRPRKTSIPTPSRSNTTRHLPTPTPTNGSVSRLAQRASHIPAPKPPPSLGNLSSSRSTGIPARSPSRLASPNAAKKPPTRATHIPTVRSRPSPVRNSLFGLQRDDAPASSSNTSPLRPESRNTLPRYPRK